MTRPSEDRLLAFLEGAATEEERTRLLDEIERDPDLARDLRFAARGLAAVQAVAGADAQHAAPGPAATASRVRISPWWAVAAAAIALLVSVPSTLWLSARGATDETAGLALGPGEIPEIEPAFVLVLHGRWPDAGTITADETQRRAAEYWGWTQALAETGVLRAAGDLRWEPGRRLGPEGSLVAVASDIVESPDFLVGMFALDVDSYEEAMAIARECPHLRYGGSVSVRPVARKFFTTAP